MQLIRNNPYRLVGLLVGATAAEQRRQLTRLQRFLEAEQEPDQDFSFPSIGELSRSLDSVSEAASKLNLDSDKMGTAIFWFYNGNSITDEPAFDYLKEGNIKEAVSIWAKLTNDKEVEKRNASAFQNLSTLLLNASISESSIKEDVLRKGIRLKLKFLESELVKDYKALATDETYKISKHDLQLLFLNQIKSEIDKAGGISTRKFLGIIAPVEFVAKKEFLKEFIQAPINLIEEFIKKCKVKRKENPSDAEIYGNELFEDTQELIEQVSNILDKQEIKYQSIADKLSEEILQCGIDFFKEFKDNDHDFDPSGESMELFETATTIAVGNIVKQRCQENIYNLQEWIDEKPIRDRQKKIQVDLDYIMEAIESFENTSDSILNANKFIDNCKPRLLKIKSEIGQFDELYLNLSSAVVQNAQGMLVSAVNSLVESFSKSIQGRAGLGAHKLEDTIKSALDLTFKIGGLDMVANVKNHYAKNLDGLKSLASQLHISTLHPKERIKKEISQAETRLRDIEKTTFFHAELRAANTEMGRIKEWQFLRSEDDKARQIRDQQIKINQLVDRSDKEKAAQLKSQQATIVNLKNKLKQIDY